MPLEVIIMKSQLEIKVRKELADAIKNTWFYARRLQYYRKHGNKAEIDRNYHAMNEYNQVVYTLCDILDKKRTYWMVSAKRMRIGDFI